MSCSTHDRRSSGSLPARVLGERPVHLLALLVAGLVPLVLGDRPAAATPSHGAGAGAMAFRDPQGEHLVRPVAWRRARSGRWLHELEVLSPGAARPYRAYAGRDVVIQLERGAAPEATFARLGVVPVRPLMPSAGLWLVREPGAPSLDDAAGADAPPATVAPALHLAERLRGLVGRGPLRQATPDLYLARRAHALPVPPDDPRYAGQWYFHAIGIEDAWARTTGSPETTVVIVDNGCDLAHPELRDRLDPGRDVFDGDDDPSHVPGVPGNNHGTACAGIVGATANNGMGIAGACPECRLRCVRLLGPGETLVAVSADVEAFQFALQTGAAVVSNSWGFVEPAPVPAPIAAAIEELYDRGRGGRGALVVFAAGNEDRPLGDDEITSVRGVINVGAINNFDEAAPFSNYGPSVDLTAPTGTLTTDISGSDGDTPNDFTSLFGGTSSACPVVAGVAALLFSAHPEATAAQVHDALVATTRPAPFATPDGSGHDPLYGFGIVDPAAALRMLDEQLGGPPDGGPGDPDGGPADATPGAEPGDAGTATDAASDAGGPAPDAAGDEPAGSGCSQAQPRRRAPAPGGAAAGIGLALLGAATALLARRRRPGHR